MPGPSPPHLRRVPELDRQSRAPSFDVPTLPLLVHERLSTRAIIETLTGHKRNQNLDFMADLFGDPRHSVTTRCCAPTNTARAG